ncbi:hypothetical protein E0G79_23755 [Salmonella enterica]|nr:hypothetical protein [Salmonella enterica]ECN8821519.1 hypothetical protein [Salmonella enterica subsp. enterica serovar Newport]ECY5873098.1 hypothetical protein [Salmonella enterica subsp. enterica serovar Telelkebir]MIN81588.1 hypothetical protein [Salmonella enterica subsp. enterica]ECZ9744532.1 hypothetical protein [Salmonella enterica subsp. enterica serovar Telelkebir]
MKYFIYIIMSFFFSVSVWGGIVQREVLNLKQRNVLESIINNQVNNDNDRLFVRNTWSEAKQVAEFLCRPAALIEIRKYYPDAEKVFLGSGHNSGLTLHSSTRLTGKGQYIRRGSTEWRAFHFECLTDMDKGRVKRFRYSEVKYPERYPMVPGPVMPEGAY